MNGKMNANYGDDASLETELLNPFIHRLELSTTYDKIKTAIFTVAVLPFRVAAICGLLMIAWCLACIGLYGLSESDLRSKPMTGWRKDTKMIICIIMRAIFAAGGFHWITVKGKRATAKEAPVLAVAPHSSYSDALAVIYLGAPSVVAKGETGNAPIFGTMYIVNAEKMCAVHDSIGCWWCFFEKTGSNLFLLVNHVDCLVRFQEDLRQYMLYYHALHHDPDGIVKLREIIATVGQLTYRVGGMSIVVKGRQATREEAPILVIAPHSTFLDAVVVYATGFPSIIARWESGLNPWLGKLINYTQPVYVWREDPHSRQNTIKEIIERANSKLNWPQVLIFPEGTCTNRSCLITFKAGAFYPGVPVQPVCIRYPNKLDTVTWTWEGPGVLKLLWLTLTQVHSCCEIEFLPVYKPSEEEIYDPRLFANNVRKVMAKALGVPVSNYTYDDCRLMTRAKQMNLSFAGHLIEMQKLRNALGLSKTNLEESIILSNSFRSLKNGNNVSFKEFCEILTISPTDPAALQLFNLCDTNRRGYIDFKEYLLTVLVICKSGNLPDMIFLMFKLMDEEGKGRIREPVFCSVVNQALSMSTEDCSNVFRRIDKTHRGYITFDEFKSFAEAHKEFSSVFRPNPDSKSKSE